MTTLNNASIEAFIVAAEQGQTELVRSYLENGANPNECRDKYGYYTESILHRTARQDNETIVRLLLEYGADCRALNGNRMHPLHEAALANRMAIVRILLEHHIAQNITEDIGWCTLALAALNGDAEEVARLTPTRRSANLKDCRGWTVLRLLIYLGQTEACRLLLARGAKTDSPAKCSKLDRNLLYGAVKQNHRATAKLLIQYGAKLDSGYAYSLLTQAIYNANHDMLRLLLEHGADVNACDQFGDTPLLQAVMRYNSPIQPEKDFIEVIKILLNYGANCNIRNRWKNSAVHEALYAPTRVFKLLLDHGADIHLRNEYGLTLFLRALSIDCPDKVRLLLARGANIFDVDDMGSGALHYAFDCRNADTLLFLLNQGLDINLSDKVGDKPLFNFFRRSSDVAILKRLLKYGANVNHANNEGNTLLHMAIEHTVEQTPDYLECLISYGADVNAANVYGETPLHMAADRGLVKEVKCLLTYGAAPDVIKNNTVSSPLLKAASNVWDYCGRSNHPRCLQLLLNYGADIERGDAVYPSPLYAAVYRQAHLCVEVLLAKGARVQVCDADKNTPLHLAVKANNRKIVKLLLHYGADPHATNKAGHSPLNLAKKTPPLFKLFNQ